MPAGYVVDPTTGRIRDPHRNYLALQRRKRDPERPFHLFVNIAGKEYWVDELVYKTVHPAKSPKRFLDKSIGLRIPTTIVHMDSDPANVGIDNLRLVPEDIDYETRYYRSLMVGPPVRQRVYRTTTGLSPRGANAANEFFVD